MTNALSREEVTRLANSALHGGSAVLIAVAIAQAESGFDADATHVNSNGSTDTGLWQINSVHGYSQSALKNPSTNAAAMAKISKNGTDWTPWTTYTSGAYKQYLGSAGESGTVVGDAGTGDLVKGTSLNPLSAVGDVFNKIFNADLWKRIGVGYLGAVLIVAGIAIIVANSRAGKEAIGTAAGLASKGLV